VRDPNNIAFSLGVNGKARQTSNTNDMIFSMQRLVEFASAFYTLYPGDILYTGTPEGVGAVKPGDVMRLTSELLGNMDVPVRAHQPA
jgi:2-keto-4-pentenoate hydratase/2-oxohepta-3-ene-1,7-dioic acid hydratase in catechol pathway